MNPAKVEPLIPASKSLPELTFKVIVLSIILTLILCASNAYLALKVGVTVSASIPAAVIAMGVFQFFKKSNILETNIVQTAASAGEGIAASMAFILPAFVILGFWDHFAFKDVAIIGVVGGSLGVLFSIPLRRVLLNHKELPFPEGTAIGNVLRAKASNEGGMKNLVLGGGVGSLIVILQSGFKLVAESTLNFFVLGRFLVGFGSGFAPALLAAGYIVGANVGVTLLVGSVLGWLIGIPILSYVYGFDSTASVTQSVMSLWSNYLRFVGVGTMLVGGIWTILVLVKPIYNGLRTSFGAIVGRSTPEKTPRTERDIPLNFVLSGIAIFTLIAFFAFLYLVKASPLVLSNTVLVELGLIALVYILLGGFVAAAICGYLVGLVGVTNSPISGIFLGSVLLLALLFLPLLGIHLDLTTHADKIAAASLVILVVSFVGGASVIANENIQDLKAGQMVGATPWKQQAILFLGVLVGSLIMGPILNLLFNAYGLGGVFPNEGMDKTQMLAAPQAGLMATVARGVFGHDLNWSLITVGGILAVVCIIVDRLLRPFGYRLPVMALGVGIYLPIMSTIPITIGGFVAAFVNHKLKKKARVDKKLTEQLKHDYKQRSILLCCGLVAGAALTGVVLAIPFVIMGSADALSLVSKAFEPIAQILGWVVTGLLCFWMYRTATKKML